MNVAEMIEMLSNVEDKTIEVRAAVMREMPNIEGGTKYVTDPMVSYEIKKLSLSMTLPEQHKTVMIGFEIPVEGVTPPEPQEPEDTIH